MCRSRVVTTRNNHLPVGEEQLVVTHEQLARIALPSRCPNPGSRGVPSIAGSGAALTQAHLTQDMKDSRCQCECRPKLNSDPIR